jgi:hypothetical protein
MCCRHTNESQRCSNVCCVTMHRKLRLHARTSSSFTSSATTRCASQNTRQQWPEDSGQTLGGGSTAPKPCYLRIIPSAFNDRAENPNLSGGATASKSSADGRPAHAEARRRQHRQRRRVRLRALPTPQRAPRRGNDPLGRAHQQRLPGRLACRPGPAAAASWLCPACLHLQVALI